MTPERFIEALRKSVLQEAVGDVFSLLEQPPGRSPSPELVEASSWFRALGPEDRGHLAKALGLMSRHVMFGALAVLDGARVVDGEEPRGQFRLVFRRGDQEWELVGGRSPPLHELL
jgi:hypothetical protein